MEGGYHHAVYGARRSCSRPLNLCYETLDAIRNHSWNRPTPGHPRGRGGRLGDRIAYVCHDFEDAVDAGVVAPDDLPAEVGEVVGRGPRAASCTGFITAMVETVADTGVVGMRPEAEALAAFRAFNYERIYLRPDPSSRPTGQRRWSESLAERFSQPTPRCSPTAPASGRAPGGHRGRRPLRLGA